MYRSIPTCSVFPSTTLTLDLLGVSRVSPAMRAGGLQLYPQLTLGAEWKHLNPGSSVVPIVAGVSSKTSGVDLYVSTTKLFLGPGVLVNATLRATRANQNGWLLSVPYAITS